MAPAERDVREAEKEVSIALSMVKLLSLVELSTQERSTLVGPVDETIRPLGGVGSVPDVVAVAVFEAAELPALLVA